jgi:quinol monooxygenase YgiN
MSMAKVHVLVEVSIHDGKLDTFKSIAQEMIAGTRKETGTLGYEWYFSADGARCRLLETYASAEPLLAHFTGPVVQQLVPKLAQQCSIDHFEVYGDPDAQAEAILAGFGAVIYRHWDGVERQTASAR